MGTSFYTAHFSDPHFSVSPNRRGYISAPGVPAKWRTHLAWFFLHGVNRRRLLGSFSLDAAKELSNRLKEGFLGNSTPPYDCFIVTGDLATTGDKEDLKIARDFFEGSLPSIDFNLYKYPSDKLVILPGNHDRYDGIRCKPGGLNFEDSEAFSTHWRLTKSKHLNHQRDKVQSFNFSKDGDSLTLIAADFSLPQDSYRFNPFKYLGKGLVDEVILKDLVQRTERAKQKSAVLWAVHFPPRFKGLSRFLRLEYEDRLIDTAKRIGVTHILAGHTHISDRYFAGSKKSNYITVICAGSPTADGTELPSFFDLEIVVCNKIIKDIKPHIFVLREFHNKHTKEKVRRFSLT